MFNTTKVTPKKTPVKKKSPVKKAPVKEVETVVEAPAVMQQPGFYNREQGVLFLSDEFNKETIMPIISAIHEYNSMEVELAPERITILINSPGGHVRYCLELIDTMLSSIIPVDTFATGMAASCGLLTLMSGEHRMASSTAQLMSHQYAAGSAGKEHELYGRLKSFKQTSKWMVEHYQHCTGLSEKKIRKKLLHPTDEWLTADEAKSFNLIDEVVSPYAIRDHIRGLRAKHNVEKEENYE